MTAAFAYEPASWDTPIAGCQPGAVALIDYAHSLGFGDLGCFNDRSIAGTDIPSLHREGRAVDLTVGDKPEWFRLILDDLVDVHAVLGVQQIIYDGSFWRVGNDGWRLLADDADPHRSHAHIELTWRGATDNTAELYADTIAHEAVPPTTADPEEETVPPTLYRDVAYANVFAIFASGEVLHLSSALVDHYVAAGSGPVIVGDPTNVQTVQSLLAKAGLTGTDALVPFGL